jgi:hypothetical protein
MSPQLPPPPFGRPLDPENMTVPVEQVKRISQAMKTIETEAKADAKKASVLEGLGKLATSWKAIAVAVVGIFTAGMIFSACMASRAAKAEAKSEGIAVRSDTDKLLKPIIDDQADMKAKQRDFEKVIGNVDDRTKRMCDFASWNAHLMHGLAKKAGITDIKTPPAPCD